MSREQAFDLGGTGQSGRNHGAQDQDHTSCVLLALTYGRKLLVSRYRCACFFDNGILQLELDVDVDFPI